MVHDLTAAVAEGRPDLLVMATHARGAWDHLWAGSVVAWFIRGITVPLLLAPVQAAHRQVVFKAADKLMAAPRERYP
ncbi:MAG: hypothetical protein C4303_10300 [candidate division GAL15 bacterium]